MGPDAELTERLAALGLDEREARAYLHLCAVGPSRAGDVAAVLGLKRTETYRALETLVGREFALAQLSRPVVYEAIPPETVFAREAERRERELKELETVRADVLSAIADARRHSANHHGRHAFRILQGRRAILHAAAAMLHGMKDGQAMVSTYFGPANATPRNPAYQETIKRAQEGISMRLLLRDAPGLADSLRGLLEAPKVSVRCFDYPHPLRMTIVDGREVLVWLVNDPSLALDAVGDVALWTNAPDFIHAQQVLYESLWAGGREPRASSRHG